MWFIYAQARWLEHHTRYTYLNHSNLLMKNLNPCDPDDALEYLRTAIFDIKLYGQKNGDSFILSV